MQEERSSVVEDRVAPLLPLEKGRPSNPRLEWVRALNPQSVRLLRALRAGSAEEVRGALSEGADVNVVNQSLGNASALHMACAHGSADCLLTLLRHSARPAVVLNAEGDSPLHVCCRHAESSTPVILYMTSFGVQPPADINRITGTTFLHDLVANTSMDIISLRKLVQWVCNTYNVHALLGVRSAARQTVLDVAASEHPNDGPLQQIIIQHGGRRCEEIDQAELAAVVAHEKYARPTLVSSEASLRIPIERAEKHERRLVRRYLRHCKEQQKLIEKETSKRELLNASELTAFQRFAPVARDEEEAIRALLLERQRCRAATMMQRLWRRYQRRVAELRQLQLESSARTIQRFWRWRRNERLRAQQAAAACVLQAFCRRWVLMRRTLEGLRDRRQHERAVVARLATNFRVRRLHAQRMTAVKDWCWENTLALDRAAIAVQAAFRGWKVRRHFNAAHRSIRVVQKAWNRSRRLHHEAKLRSCNMASDRIWESLRFVEMTMVRRRFITLLTEETIGTHMDQLKTTITRVLWRENFCAVFRDIVFRLKVNRVLTALRARETAAALARAGSNAAGGGGANAPKPLEADAESAAGAQGQLSASETAGDEDVQSAAAAEEEEGEHNIVEDVEPVLHIEIERPIHIASVAQPHAREKYPLPLPQAPSRAAIWTRWFSKYSQSPVVQNQALVQSTLKTTEKLVPLSLWKLRMEPWCLLFQQLVIVAMLISYGAVPRSDNTKSANVADIVMISILLAHQFLLPVRMWRLIDCAFLLPSLFCAAFHKYTGVCVFTLLLAKIPFAVELLAPRHHATSTYCSAVRQCVYHVLLLWPLGFSAVGATLRGVLLDSQLLTTHGNWGSVLWMTLSAMSPQYAIYAWTNTTGGLVGQGPRQREGNLFNAASEYATGPWQAQSAERYFSTARGVSSLSVDYANSFNQSTASWDLVASQLPAAMTMSRKVVPLPQLDNYTSSSLLYMMDTPIIQIAFFFIGLFFYLWSAMLMGVHHAMRNHYDRRDDMHLRKNKRRFHHTEALEQGEAHRATSMKALGRQLDGEMWEADVRAAKEAIDASHFDHKAGVTVHRFVRRVQDSMVAGVINPMVSNPQAPTMVKPIEKDWGKWDCRNEDPAMRLKYDVGIIETALKKTERNSFMERLMRRQWVGAVYYRESNVFILATLATAAAVPNLYTLEAIYSALFTVELLVSLKVLGVEFVLSRYVRLFVRLFCIVIGFAPPAIPYVAFRAIRLVEGWSHVLTISSVMRWCVLYCVLTFFILWMVGFVAVLQQGAIMRSASEESASFTKVFCDSDRHCLVAFLRELVIPAWTPTHFDVTVMPPVGCLIIVMFRFIFVPFFLSIILHPLLQLSAFSGRFVRLVVHSLHKDVIDYLRSYVEGREWYSHRRLRVPLPTGIITRVKMWMFDARRRFWHGEKDPQPWASTRMLSDALHTLDPGASFFVGRAPGSSKASNMSVFLQRAAVPDDINMVLSSAQYATFEENELYDNPSAGNRPRLMKLRRVLRNPVLHVLNSVLTLLSVAFLWVETAKHSEIYGPNRTNTAIASVAIHSISCLVALVLIPRDATAVCTFIGVSALIVSMVVQYHENSEQYSYLFCLRYVSLLRLAQLQFFVFASVHRVTVALLRTSIRLWLPLIVAGIISYLAELLRAQIYLAASYDPINATASNTTSNTTQVEQTRTYAQYLASQVRHNKSFPNGDDVRSLFAYYFSVDSYIFYSIFTYYLTPASCITAALAYLRWTGTNLVDANLFVVNAIPHLEDPITVARFRLRRPFFRWIAHVVLVVNLIFISVFSPTAISYNERDFYLFFAFETVFCTIGVLDSFSRLGFALHRCARSWVAWEQLRENTTAVITPWEDSFFLLCETIHLLYWSVTLPIAASLLAEPSLGLITSSQYTAFFCTLRFVLLLRMLPRQCLLSMIKLWRSFTMSAVAMTVYIVAAASVLADVCASESSSCTDSNNRVTREAWNAALEALMRMIFTGTLPSSMNGIWLPTNTTAIAEVMIHDNTSTVFVTREYSSSVLLVILASAGRILFASIAGVCISIFFLPLQSLSINYLPRKALLLYEALCGGTDAIVTFGAMLHDDMRPDDRRSVQKRKFERMFIPEEGIPMWAVPHILEELGICRPSRQRRLMCMLHHLLDFLPVAAQRRDCVEEYMMQWITYQSGGPAKMSFDVLPVFPQRSSSGSGNGEDGSSATKKKHARRFAGAFATSSSSSSSHPQAVGDGSGGSTIWSCPQRFVSPLRLVQAIAILEFDFPSHSSVESKIWLDFFLIVQRIRGATLIQSLWRMYVHVKAFEKKYKDDREVLMVARMLRRKFYRNRVRASTSFLINRTYGEAVMQEHSCFNPGTGHFDVLDRLRENYANLDDPNFGRLRPENQTASQVNSAYSGDGAPQRSASASPPPPHEDQDSNTSSNRRSFVDPRTEYSRATRSVSAAAQKSALHHHHNNNNSERTNSPPRAAARVTIMTDDVEQK